MPSRPCPRLTHPRSPLLRGRRRRSLTRLLPYNLSPTTYPLSPTPYSLSVLGPYGSMPAVRVFCRRKT